MRRDSGHGLLGSFRDSGSLGEVDGVEEKRVDALV